MSIFQDASGESETPVNLLLAFFPEMSVQKIGIKR